MPTKAEWMALWNKCYWQWGNDGTNDGYYVFKPYAAGDKQKIKTSGHTYSTTSGDPYIFLPVLQGKYFGGYWSQTRYEYDIVNIYYLYFDEEVSVNPENSDYNWIAYSIRLVQRSSN